MSAPRLLLLNPGGISTKIAVFEGAEALHTVSLDHTAEELAPLHDSTAQAQWRAGQVRATLDPASVAASVSVTPLVRQPLVAVSASAGETVVTGARLSMANLRTVLLTVSAT